MCDDVLIVQTLSISSSLVLSRHEYMKTTHNVLYYSRRQDKTNEYNLQNCFSELSQNVERSWFSISRVKNRLVFVHADYVTKIINTVY